MNRPTPNAFEAVKKTCSMCLLGLKHSAMPRVSNLIKHCCSVFKHYFKLFVAYNSLLSHVLHRYYLCYDKLNVPLELTQKFNLFPDLMTVLDREVDELSGGELQRFACAVVCIQKADM